LWDTRIELTEVECLSGVDAMVGVCLNDIFTGYLLSYKCLNFGLRRSKCCGVPLSFLAII